MDLYARLIAFSRDPWVDQVQLTPHSVVCAGCGALLSLDKSPKRPYYPGHWKHHRKRCGGIQTKLAAEGKALVRVFDITYLYG
jgi:hypothetical protein